MLIRFDFPIDPKHIDGEYTGGSLSIVADVTNPGEDKATPFIKEVTTNGMIALWVLKPSVDLFHEVCEFAIEKAKSDLAEIDYALNSLSHDQSNS